MVNDGEGVETFQDPWQSTRRLPEGLSGGGADRGSRIASTKRVARTMRELKRKTAGTKKFCFLKYISTYMEHRGEANGRTGTMKVTAKENTTLCMGL
jgi:hypothetical protein